MNDHTPSGKLRRGTLALEVVLATVFLIGGAAAVWHAIGLARTGGPISEVTGLVGVAVILFGGCLDPVNSAALFLPWVLDDVAEPTPFSKARWFFFVPGLLIAISGWIWGHWIMMQ
jgi:hypothetical protein